jgi:ketosteroid isomerase-like protein
VTGGLFLDSPPEHARCSHGDPVGAADLDAIVSDYTEDAVLVTPDGVVQGRDAIRGVFAGLLGEIPDAAWDIPTRHYVGDLLFIEWTAVAEKARAEGVDTFVFAGDSIRAQTVRLSLEHTA